MSIPQGPPRFCSGGLALQRRYEARHCGREPALLHIDLADDDGGLGHRSG